MKSLCIKTNDSAMTCYLLEQFQSMDFPNTYLSVKEFCHYKNIILHCKDSNETLFIHTVSNILTKSILLFLENVLMKDMINLQYFYFNTYEKNKIFEHTLSLLNTSDNTTIKYDLLNNTLFDYLSNHHSFYVKAFVEFRLPHYQNFISETIETAVNQFLIDKEYSEFINILRLYIQSETSEQNIKHLHVIYHNHHSTIINDDKEIITCNDNITKAKYISDISFSSNDLALNTLLNLLPQKITIHLVDSFIDEFINTLQLIFQDKIEICEDCNICQVYRFQKIEP